MMHLLGLNSFQYFFGLVIADWLISLIPVTIGSLLLVPFDEIMERSEIGDFFIVYAFFGCAINVLAYTFSHLFSNPDTGI